MIPLKYRFNGVNILNGVWILWLWLKITQKLFFQEFFTHIRFWLSKTVCDIIQRRYKKSECSLHIHWSWLTLYACIVSSREFELLQFHFLSSSFWKEKNPNYNCMRLQRLAVLQWARNIVPHQHSFYWLYVVTTDDKHTIFSHKYYYYTQFIYSIKKISIQIEIEIKKFKSNSTTLQVEEVNGNKHTKEIETIDMQ